jgi:hypothetical protein
MMQRGLRPPHVASMNASHARPVYNGQEHKYSGTSAAHPTQVVVMAFGLTTESST